MKASQPLALCLALSLIACSPAPTTPSPSSTPSAQPSASAPTASTGLIKFLVDGKATPVKPGFMIQDLGGGAGLQYFFGETPESGALKGWSVRISTSWNAKKETSQINYTFTETYAPAACPTCTAYANYEVAVQLDGAAATRSVPAGATATVATAGSFRTTFAGNATMKFPTETTRRFEVEVAGLPLTPTQP